MKRLDRITVDARVCTGQAAIRGMRITVSVILRMLAAGKTVEDVLLAYPELERLDVLQAIEYAAWTSSEHVLVENLVAV